MRSCTKQKAQAAIEYMMIFSVQLVIIGLLWTMAGGESERAKFEVQTTYAKNAINRISDTSNFIAIQGPPAQTYISALFPENLQNIFIAGDTITFEMRYNDFANNLSVKSSANLTGSLSAFPGTHRILIKSVNSSVDIRDG